MQVKTFEATTMKEAVKAVKSTFGQDAVILKTKEKFIDDKNRVFEVTAAVPQQPRSLGAQAVPNSVDDHESIERLVARIDHLAQDLVKRSQMIALEESVEELKILVLEALRHKDGGVHLPTSLVSLYQQLSMMGVDESQLAQLFKFLQELPGTTADQESEYFRSQAIKWMLKRIHLANTQNQGSVMIQAFVGPHGSGKTTLVTKVAAQLAKNHRHKVLVVSYDQSRLGGTDQLRLLCKLLNLSFETMETPEDLETLLKKHHQSTHVLIDTSGRNPKNQQHFSDLKGLADLPVPIEFQLVLSCSEKSMQIERSMRSFAQLGLGAVHFTRLDESWCYGEIYNVTSRWGVGLGYFSIGSQVPDDLERASRERVIERLFSIG